MDDPVKDNPDRRRFELEIDGMTVFASYRRDGDELHIPYVEAPPPLRGTGAADRLMHGVMRIARAEGRRVVPICGYAAAWMRRHREYRDLL
ncbi:GNAT family N-acetyltransferase [Azospirillum halopraeferens]|uniref:GNAT family N-acetyltransferase n=1 Tax=Azospirillum halopraeferens TaxID=34010 RepID=UPI00041AD1E2|nr:GNAT family N-acetyltransferase [Azospirillum halopraeferens]